MKGELTMTFGYHDPFVDEEDMREPPSKIAGVPVRSQGEAEEMHGGHWITMIPTDSNDGRVWEFDARSGTILKTSWMI